MKKILKRIWHDIYYVITYPWGMRLAMTCQHATALIDHGGHPKNKFERLRLLLHLSLCQACSFYNEVSHALKKLITQLVKKTEGKIDFTKFNQELIEKYRKK